MNGSLLSLSVQELPKVQNGEPGEALNLLSNKVGEQNAANALLFDIRLLLDGKEVQPDGNVTVTFLGLSEVTGKEKIFHVDEAAQTVTDMNAQAQDDAALLMETNHFSTYAIVPLSDEIIVIPPSNPNDYFRGKDNAEDVQKVKPNSKNIFGDARKFNVFCLEDFITGLTLKVQLLSAAV